jgi:HSP20 family protein
MFLTKCRPHRMSRFGREFDDLFDGFRSSEETVAFNPAVDIVEEAERFLIKADLPGVKQEEIAIKVHDGSLILSGKREEQREEEQEKSYYSERRLGSFHRSFKLGDTVDTDKIEAKYDSGVLTVLLPKKEETKPRQIEVAVN